MITKHIRAFRLDTNIRTSSLLKLHTYKYEYIWFTSTIKESILRALSSKDTSFFIKPSTTVFLVVPTLTDTRASIVFL